MSVRKGRVRWRQNSCSRKTKFGSPEEARQTHPIQGIYRCRFCGQYHLTSGRKSR